METVIGACSICGGEVWGYMGAWWSVTPPPPPRCMMCGAVPSSSVPPVVPMVPSPYRGSWRQTYSGNTSVPVPFVTFRASATVPEREVHVYCDGRLVGKVVDLGDDIG